MKSVCAWTCRSDWKHGRLDILPALKGEDSFVGHRADPEFSEGNFHSSRGVYRVRALHVGPQNEGRAYSTSEMDAVSACAAPDTTQTGVSEYRATASGWSAGGHGSCHRPYSADDGEVQPRRGALGIAQGCLEGYSSGRSSTMDCSRSGPIPTA